MSSTRKEHLSPNENQESYSPALSIGFWNESGQSSASMDDAGTFNFMNWDTAVFDRDVDQLFPAQLPQVDTWTHATAFDGGINDYSFSWTAHATLPIPRLDSLGHGRAALRDLHPKFVCLICGTSVSRKHDCRRHLLLHAGERSMKAFDELHALKDYLGSTPSVRPDGRIYSCGSCWNVQQDLSRWLSHVELQCGVHEPQDAQDTVQWRWVVQNQLIGLLLVEISNEDLQRQLDQAIVTYSSDSIATTDIIVAMEVYIPGPRIVQLALDALIKEGVNAQNISGGPHTISRLLARGPAIPPLRNPTRAAVYTCNIPGCGLIFDEPSKFRDHQQKHNPPQYHCNLCQRPFRYEKDARRHEETVHAVEHPTCSICKKTYPRRDNLNRHIRTVHGIDPKDTLIHVSIPVSQYEPSAVTTVSSRSTSDYQSPDRESTPVSSREDNKTVIHFEEEPSKSDFVLPPIGESQIRILRLHSIRKLASGLVVPRAAILTHSIYEDDLQQPGTETNGTWIGQYTALSYVWGEKNAEDTTLLLKHVDNWTPLRIRRNLYEALIRLTQAGITHLWIDALCINQDDQEERARQVAMMADIYSHATNVIVWLGEEDEHSREVFAFIHNARTTNISWDLDSLDLRSICRAIQNFLRRPWFSRLWVVQEVTVARDITLYCGETTMSWAGFSRAISFFYAAGHRWRHRCKATDDSERPSALLLVELSDLMFRRSITGEITERILSLDNILPHLAHFKVSEPKDTIFALVGLTTYPLQNHFELPSSAEIVRSWSTHPPLKLQRNLRAEPRLNDRKDYHGLEYGENQTDDTFKADNHTSPSRHVSNILDVDYTKPLVDLYKELFSKVVRRVGSLDLLARPWALLNEREPSPTWIRRAEVLHGKTVPRSLLGLPGLSTKSKSPYTACGASKALFPPDSRNASTSMLSVAGFLLGSIHDRSHSVDHVIPKSWGSFLRKTVSRAHSNQIWRLLVANRDNASMPAPVYWEDFYQQLFGEDFSEVDLLELMRADDCTLQKYDYLERLSHVLQGRALAWAENKYNVLGPADMKRGDRIAYILGCSAPLIVREVSLKSDQTRKRRRSLFSQVRGHGPETPSWIPDLRLHDDPDRGFMLVGECYVHGMMDGEALAHRERQDIPFETIKIV